VWWKYFFTGNFNVIRYTIARFFSLIISLIVASLVIFSVIEVIPGDPASVHFVVAGHPRFRVRHTRLGGFGEPGLRRA
jgi:cell shape-determining protein MreC